MLKHTLLDSFGRDFLSMPGGLVAKNHPSEKRKSRLSNGKDMIQRGLSS